MGGGPWDADLHIGITTIVRIRFRAGEVNKWFVVRSRIGTYMGEFVIIIRVGPFGPSRFVIVTLNQIRLRIRVRADLHTGLTAIVRIRFRAREVNKWFVVRSRIGTYMDGFVIIIRGAKR